MPPLPPIDQQKLIQAAVIVILFGLFILGLTYVVPVLGILFAFIIIGLVIYAIYKLLGGQ